MKLIKIRLLSNKNSLMKIFSFHRKLLFLDGGLRCSELLARRMMGGLFIASYLSSKFECIRKSNKGKWTFQPSKGKVLYDEQASDFVQQLAVCNDCSTGVMKI